MAKRVDPWLKRWTSTEEEESVVRTLIRAAVDVVAGGAIRAGKDRFTSTTAGFWIGIDPDDGLPKMNIGGSTYYFKFDGTDTYLITPWVKINNTGFQYDTGGDTAFVVQSNAVDAIQISALDNTAEDTIEGKMLVEGNTSSVCPDASLRLETRRYTGSYTAALTLASTDGLSRATLYANQIILDNGAVDLAKVTTPSSPPTDFARLFCRTSGGKLQLCALFPTGAVQVIAAEP